jgi:kinesin family member 2/24
LCADQVLTLVDLAGSEHRIDSMHHSAQRRKECSAINSSLMALKDIMRAKAAGTPLAHFYRKSKLTMALKDSFASPQAHTIVVACVSPASKDTEHSLSTLR